MNKSYVYSLKNVWSEYIPGMPSPRSRNSIVLAPQNPFLSLPYSTLKLKLCLDFYHHRLALHVFIFHISKTIQYLFHFANIFIL